MKNNIIWITEKMIDMVEIDNNVCNAAVQADDVIDFIAIIFDSDSERIRFETDGARDAAEELLMDAYSVSL